MKSLSLVLLWIALATCLFAQQEVVVKKEKSTEKVVSVNVEEGDDGHRVISVTTDSDGEQSVFKWSDDGEIPADVKKQLEDANIDIAILDGSGDQREIRIEVDEDIDMSDKEIRKMIVIKKDDGEGMMEMDWDGEGEMPEEMQKLLEEHDINIDELHEEHGSGNVRIRKKMKGARGERRMKQKKRHSKAMRDGRRINKEEERSYKIITKDDDGNEKVMEWTTDFEGPEHMEKDIHIMRLGEGRPGIPHGDGNVFFFSDEKDIHLSDAYMGAQIATSNNGALILDVMKDSPADKAGLDKDDIVTRVNGARARSMDGLLTLLTFFDPEDQVELTVTRDGKEKKLKMTLGKRPDAYR